MKKLLIALLVVVALFLGGRGYISGKGESYLKETLQAFNTLEQGKAKAELEKFENSFSGAEALIRLSVAGTSQAADFPLKQPLELREKIDYGPVFLSEMMPGLIRVRMQPRVSEWLRPEAKKRFLRTVPGDINLSYTGILDWSHVYHERGRSSRIVGKGTKSGESFLIEPVQVQSSFSTRTLQGEASISTAAMQLSNPAGGEELKMSEPRLEFRIESFDPKGPVFGGFGLRAQEVELRTKHRKQAVTLRFVPAFEAALQKKGEKWADLSLALRMKAEDEATRKLWEGIGSLTLSLKLQSAGIEGLIALSEMQKERMKLQEQIAQAVGKKDDIAMQKAILALSALDERWVEIYNKLFVKGKTRLLVDETIITDKKSRLQLNLLYIGEPLRGNTMSAMISLATNADRLVEGSFDLELEQALAQKLYPQAAMILDSMVSKGMAKLEDGVYKLKGEIRDGKIVINGTRYAPQELLMLILM
ncbi:DUF945 family protein [Nitratifractor sp.]